MTPRTYLVALVDGGGTLPPELAIVRGLVERGHRVTVLGEDTMVDEVAATGADFRPWVDGPNRPSRRAEDDPYRDWECTNPLSLFRRLLDEQLVGPAPGYAADTAAAIQDLQPDVVACTMFALGAMVAAEAAGVPYVVFHSNVYILPVPGRTPFGLGLAPAAGPLGRLRDRVVGAISGRPWEKGKPRLDEVRATYGLAPLDRFWDQVHHADVELVLAAEAFDFPGPLPSNVRYVGPVLDDPSWSRSWTPPPGEDPLVLVALSSTFQDQVGCLQRIVDALADLPVRAVVTTGQAVEPDALHAPANVQVVASAPHTEVLRHAAAVVTHGGHGTVMKSLAAGVPMVLLPHGRDQADNAVRVTRRHAGVSVGRRAKPAKIRAAVETVLADPSYAADARALGDLIVREADGHRALDEMEAVG